jgi:hypothetical protein
LNQEGAEMGITTIVNLNPLPAVKPIDRSVDPPAMERVEQTTRIADATYSPRGSKASRGSESGDDEDDEELEAPEEDDAEAILTVKSDHENPENLINFVA